MSFEPFERNPNTLNAAKDGLFIAWKKTKKGYFTGGIYFNKVMRIKLGIHDFKSVETFRDDTNKLVALRFNNDERSNTNAVIRKNGNGRYLQSTSFVKLMVEEYGYPANATVDYKVIEGGLVVLLKEQGAEE